MLFLIACDVSEENEVSLGAQAAGEIDAEVPLVQDAAVVGYVARLGRDIARHTARRDLDWQFRVVDSPQINAFAVPGGYVYVNRGLIEATGSVSELAGVLGHEIGHVVQRHLARMLAQQKTDSIISMAWWWAAATTPPRRSARWSAA